MVRQPDRANSLTRGLPRVFALGLLLLGACPAGAYSNGIVRRGSVHYAIGTPDQSWSEMRLPSNDVAFEARSTNAIVQANGRCDAALDAPLTALTGHLLIQFTNRDLRTQETFELDGREALRTHIVARLDGVPREMLLVVLKKDGCAYDFALIAPPGAAFEGARPTFEAMVAGFHTLRDGR